MKAITDGNYIVRPFVTHKTQTYGYAFLSGGNPAQVSIDLAVVPPTSSWQFSSGSEPINPSGIFKTTLYESVKHLFYDTSTVDRQFQPTGSSLYVISAAQPAYGEQIRPGTFSLTEGTSVGSIVDDGNGGLIFTGSTSSSLFQYTVGDNIAAKGGTFTGPAATRTYRDVTGSLKTAGLNVPRDNHYEFNKATSQYERVLLIEPRRTNQFQSSSAFESTYWGNMSASYSASAIVSPNGTSLAGKFNAVSGNIAVDPSQIFHTVTFTGTATQSVSIFAKSAEYSVFDFYIAHASGNIGMVCDSSNGNVISTAKTTGGGKLFTSKSVAYTNGWYRFEFSGAWTASVASPATVVMLLRSGSGAGAIPLAYTASGAQGLYIYGAQFEQDSPFVSTYIHSATASTLRDQEFLNFPFTELPQEMSVTADFIDRGIGGYTFPILWSIGMADPQFNMYVGGGGFTGKAEFALNTQSLSSMGLNATSQGDNVVLTTNFFKSGSGFSTRVVGVKNGANMAASTVNPPVTMTTFGQPKLAIGNDATNALSFGGFGLKSFKVMRPAKSARVGNIFYNSGIAVINGTDKNVALGDAGINMVTGSATNIKFDATHTIYEHYVICSLDQGELNYSMNPSVKNNAADGFKVLDHMATGSLHPYMTQIGLYNDDGELVAIGKFPRPLKRAVGSQQTVIIRFDA